MSSEINGTNNLNYWHEKEKDWQNWTKEIWDEFLNFRCARKKMDYIDSANIIADYIRETEIKENYKGRELFELIQNADDEGVDCPEPNQMLIELTPDALFIANTGISFKPKGIVSLMIPNNSPKLFHSNLIGYKGLGFRAILGWASSIIIQSHKLFVGFSAEIAEKMFIELENEFDLIKKNPEIQYLYEHHKIPIAILSVPYIPEVDKCNSEKEAKVYKNINKYVGKFDTIIGLIFDMSKTYDDIQSNIRNFDDKTFIFLNHLEKIEFKSPEYSRTLEVIRKKDNVKFKDSESWKIFDSGNIKLEINGTEKKSEYQIKLAFCDNKEINNNDKIKERKLFVYLPTDVNFPFHFIAHATFELDPSRKHLMESDINKCIARKLAEFIAKTANDSIKDINNPWNALIFVTPQNIDTIESQTDLEKLEFKEKFISAISSRNIEIIPNLNKTFKSKENIKWLDANFNGLLNGDQFEDVCLFPEQDYIRKFLKEDIQIKKISYMELRKKINEFLKEKSPTINDRANIIFRLINNWGTITEDTKNAYLFGWDKIPGNDSKRLIDFLKERFDIDCVKKENIEKIENDKTIRVSTEQNCLLLKLNDEKTKLYIEIDDGRTDELIAKTENNKLNIYKNTNPPELLIDQNDIPITCEHILLPPDGEPFKLEPWVPLGIVKSELITELKKKKDFNFIGFKTIFKKIEDYNINKVIESIIKGTEDLITIEKKTNDRELFHIQNMLREIWKIYIHKLPKKKYDRKKPELPIRGGGFRPADEIYIGIEYPDGKLLENLYGKLDEPGPFVENKDILSLDGSDKEIQDFLVWLGVNKEPKLIKIPNFSKDHYSSFLDHVLHKLFSDKEDLIFDHGPNSRSVTRNQLKNSPDKFEIQTIDRLEDVIDKAYPELIIAWIYKDKRFSKDNYKAKLSGCFFGSALYTRDEDLPFYPLWLLRNKEWMPTNYCLQCSPNDCIYSQKLLEKVADIIGVNIKWDHDIFNDLKIDKKNIGKVLRRIIVADDENKLPWDSFYKILLRLPETEPDGKKAGGIYNFFAGKKINDSYLFSWEDVPGNDNLRLMDFLKLKYNVDWINSDNIGKNVDGKAINVSADISPKRHLSLILNDDKVILKINNVIKDEFIAKMENGELKIYRNDELLTGKNYTEFKENGRLWGHINGEDRYISVSEDIYYGNPFLPESILNLIPHVKFKDQLDKSKVERVFCIKFLDISAIIVSETEEYKEEGGENFDQAVKKLIFIIWILTNRYNDELKKLNIQLCSKIKCSINIGDANKEIDLKGGEYIFKSNENKAYILVPPGIKSSKIYVILGKIISSILNEKDLSIKIALLAKCKDDEELIASLDEITEEEGRGKKIIAEVNKLMYPENIVSTEPDDFKGESDSGLKVGKEKLSPGDVKNPGEVIDSNKSTDNKITKETQKTKVAPDNGTQEEEEGRKWEPLPVSEVSSYIEIPLEEIPKKSIEKPKITNKLINEPKTDIKPFPPLIDRISKGNKILIGKWGEERIVNRVLKNDLEKRYPGKLMETVNGFEIITDEKKIEVVWHNKERETKTNHDITIIEDDNIKYIEVKTTITDPNEMKSFDISKDEWKFAEDNKEKYHIYRVYNAGKKDFYYTIISNPYENKELTVEPNGYTITI